jgi:NAD(P)-dependent dehydrogenase (short-subunit alcohol dehydrogenase family)
VSRTVAVVTGGSRGIGRAVVERLAHRGHLVLFTYSSNQADADEVVQASSGAAVPLRCDMADPNISTRIIDAAEELGDLTVLVNNAGITGPIGSLRTARDHTISRVLEVNLAAVIRLCRDAVTYWEAGEPRADRNIVNVSSVAASTGAPGEYVWYAASKAGVEALTVGLAKEVAAQRIRVNAVSPGTTDTSIHARAGRPDRAVQVGARMPLGRAASPDEIAAAIDWLTTADASYVTGTVLNVSGGI